MTVPNQRMKPDMRLELTTPDGETFELHTPPSKFVTNMRGWGMSPRITDTVRYPNVMGERPLAVKLDVREVSLTIMYPGCSLSQLWNHKGTLLDFLRENRTPINNIQPSRLTMYYREDGVYKARALDVFFNDGLVFVPPGTSGNQYTIVEESSFTAYNPVVYDPTIQSFPLTTFSSSLILPMTFPFTLGTHKASGTLTYTGTWESYPIIEVTGPAKNFSILNVTADKRLNYWGEVASDETVTFDLRDNIKTVTNNYGADVISRVSGNINTFVIQVSPLATGGNNAFEVYSEVYGPVTRFDITYYNRYRGV